MEKKKSNALTALLRKSVGLPAKGSSCCGGSDHAGTASTEGTDAGKRSDADACCGSKQSAREEKS